MENTSEEIEIRYCEDCGQNMNESHPELAHLLRVCPTCSHKKVVKLTYGKQRPKH